MNKAEKRKLIGTITTGIKNFLDLLDTTKQAANYNKRQHIKLSNQELAEMINQGTDSICIVIRNSIIYEQFLKMKGLKEESLKFMQGICDEIMVMQEEGREKIYE